MEEEGRSRAMFLKNKIKKQSRCYYCMCHVVCEKQPISPCFRRRRVSRRRSHSSAHKNEQISSAATSTEEMRPENIPVAPPAAAPAPKLQPLLDQVHHQVSFASPAPKLHPPPPKDQVDEAIDLVKTDFSGINNNYYPLYYNLRSKAEVIAAPSPNSWEFWTIKDEVKKCVDEKPDLTPPQPQSLGQDISLLIRKPYCKAASYVKNDSNATAGATTTTATTTNATTTAVATTSSTAIATTTAATSTVVTRTCAAAASTSAAATTAAATKTSSVFVHAATTDTKVDENNVLGVEARSIPAIFDLNANLIIESYEALQRKHNLDYLIDTTKQSSSSDIYRIPDSLLLPTINAADFSPKSSTPSDGLKAARGDGSKDEGNPVTWDLQREISRIFRHSSTDNLNARKIYSRNVTPGTGEQMVPLSTDYSLQNLQKSSKECLVPEETGRDEPPSIALSEPSKIAVHSNDANFSSLSLVADPNCPKNQVQNPPLYFIVASPPLPPEDPLRKIPPVYTKPSNPNGKVVHYATTFHASDGSESSEMNRMRNFVNSKKPASTYQVPEAAVRDKHQQPSLSPTQASSPKRRFPMPSATIIVPPVPPKKRPDHDKSNKKEYPAVESPLTPPPPILPKNSMLQQGDSSPKFIKPGYPHASPFCGTHFYVQQPQMPMNYCYNQCYQTFPVQVSHFPIIPSPGGVALGSPSKQSSYTAKKSNGSKVVSASPSHLGYGPSNNNASYIPSSPFGMNPPFPTCCNVCNPCFGGMPGINGGAPMAGGAVQNMGGGGMMPAGCLPVCYIPGLCGGGKDCRAKKPVVDTRPRRTEHFIYERPFILPCSCCCTKGCY